MSTEPSVELLDDRDEFGPKYFAPGEGFVFLCDLTYGNHEFRENWNWTRWEDPSQKKLKNIKWFKHQEEALLNLGWERDLAEGVRVAESRRKGAPKKRKTPLLSNTPRTTPETVSYLPSRQHSTQGKTVKYDTKNTLAPSLPALPASPVFNLSEFRLTRKV